MKRNVKISLVLLMCMITVFVIINLFIPNFGVKVDAENSKSAFIQTEKYNKMNAAYVKISYSDMKILESLVSGYASEDTPSCPFSEVKIIFKKEKKIILYPAGDGCPLICIKSKHNNDYLHLTDNVNNKLKRILKKYGVRYPFGI